METLIQQKNQAMQWHKQGDWQAAKSLYESLINEKQDDAELLHAYGVLLGQLKEFSKARGVIEKALTIKPRQSHYLNSLGNVLFQLNALEDAIIALKQAVKSQPNYAVAYNNLGRIYNAQHKFVAAEKYYLKALTCSPNYVDALFNLGLLYVSQSALDKAVARLEHVLQLSPNHVRAKRQLANVFLLQSQFEKSIGLLTSLVDGNQASLSDFQELGVAYFHHQQFELAVAAFESLLIQKANHLEANQYLGHVFLSQGDIEKAMNYYLRQLAIFPTYDATYNVGCIYMAKNRFADAILYFNEALTFQQDDIAALTNLGSVYLKQKDHGRALAVYQQLLSIAPDNAEIQHIVSALKQDKIPAKAPALYLQHLFNYYAPYYDKHLGECLAYAAPDQMLKALSCEMDLQSTSLHVTDLGCGTGMMGEQLKPYCARLIGIDLSEKMIEKARDKQCYDVLVCEDIENALGAVLDQDVIVAADVFTYIGDLKLVFQLVSKSLKNKGVFAFTVEATYEDKYILQSSIRYAHSKGYILSLAKDSSFDVLRFENIQLRKELNAYVEGYLVVLSPARLLSRALL